jgi:hypothetical protein
MARIRWGVVALVLVAMVGVACSGGDDESGAGGGGDEASADGSFGSDDQGGLTDDGSGSDESAAPASRSAMSLPPVGPSLIKTADWQIEVEHEGFQDAFQRIVNVAAKLGGFVLSSDMAGDEARNGSVTIRVPSESFESALDQIRTLGEVVHRSENTKDVSEEFIDLQARLRHLTAQEAVMLRLMEGAQTIEDTIRVQNQLTGVQLEVERLRGRLRFLDDQTSLSTITVYLNETGAAPVVPDEPGTLERAWQVARDTTHAIVSGFLIGGAAIVPILAVLLLALVVFRWVRPRLGRVTGS